MAKEQNTKEFKTELKKSIQEGVYHKICLYYEKQKQKDIPQVQAPDFEIEFQDDLALDIEKVKPWKNVVYLFFAPNIPDCCGTWEQAKKMRDELNKEHGSNCMPQVNAEHFGGNPHKYGQCLYVGSCRDNLHTRMKHHLGELSGTFGLHLAEWWGENPIQLFYLVFADNVEPEYLSLIEDVLWEKYKPLFGKKGPR